MCPVRIWATLFIGKYLLRSNSRFAPLAVFKTDHLTPLTCGDCLDDRNLGMYLA